MNSQEKLRLSECLWVDLKTHEQKRDFLLLGRGVDTGIIAPSMQNVLAHDYNIIVELKKDNAELNQRIVELEKELLGYKKVAKERAEFIINGEELGYISLPESENDKAYLTFMRCQLTDEYAAIEALKEPKP
jgi:hypothetical protein